MIIIINSAEGICTVPQISLEFLGAQLRRLSRCQRGQAPNLVAQFIETGLHWARYYGARQMYLLQELYLRRTFYQLVNIICDPLLEQQVRKQSLCQLHKPQLALQRFYRQQQGMHKYRALSQEARVLCHEFNPY